MIVVVVGGTAEAGCSLQRVRLSDGAEAGCSIQRVRLSDGLSMVDIIVKRGYRLAVAVSCSASVDRRVEARTSEQSANRKTQTAGRGSPREALRNDFRNELRF
jgi:hypothetical protein